MDLVAAAVRAEELRRAVGGEGPLRVEPEHLALRAGRELQAEPELEGSVGEGPNRTNYCDQSSVKIPAKFRNFR